MSLYIRRLIARRILKSIGIEGKNGDGSVQKLEKDLASAIKTTQMKKKNVLDTPQFYVNLTQAAEILHENTLASLKAINSNQLNQGADGSRKRDFIKNIEEGKKLMNITLDQTRLNKVVLQMVKNQQKKYGYTTVSADVNKQTVLVEYSSPNIAKPFHAGHMRSTILGNVIGNLYEAIGHRVLRVNFLGDWGKQFGLVCHGYRKYGNDELLEADPMRHLFDVYVQINEDVEKETKENENIGESTSDKAQRVFRNLEEGVEDDLCLWRKFRELSIKEYKQIYKRLNIDFTAFEGESMYQKQSTTALLDQLKSHNLIKVDRSTGAAYIDIDPVDKDTDKVIVMRQDGTSLYITRDIAAARERTQKYKFDKIHYVVASAQERHFKLLLAVLKKMGIPWALSQEDVHVQFGLITGMSTRRGNVVFLEDILNEARDRMVESIQSKDTSKVLHNIEEVADQLGVSALIVRDLKERRTKNYKFDWNTVLNPQSDSGVFLQYGHARLCSLVENCQFLEADDNIDVSLLTEPEAVYLIQHIARFEDAVESALKELEPCHIVNYLLSLVMASNGALHKLNVKHEQKDKAKARLLMFKCTKTTLANGLTLLGITPLTKM